MRLLRRAVVGTAATLALLGAMADPARATELTNPSLNCDSGASEIICFFNWTGGTLPFTIRWTYNNNPWPESDNAQGLRKSCTANRYVNISVVVKDVHGHSTSASCQVYCRGGDWQ